MSNVIASMSHLQRVRLLYKTCLKLHRGLPTQMQIIGDAYVKDEFRRHKEATPEQTIVFMEAWAVSFFAKKLPSKIAHWNVFQGFVSL